MTARGSAGASAALAACLVVGVLLVPLASSLVFAYGGLCPAWEDEGRMAAPASPYSVVLCSERDPTLTPAVGLGVVVAVLLGAWARRRPHGARPRRVVRLLAVVVVPGLLLGALHLVLPQDCLDGRTTSGPCGRDREL